MKVRILDAEALRAVTPAALAAYARTEGWTKTEGYGAHSDVYLRDGKDEIVVPRTAQLTDYASVVGKLIAIFGRAAGTDEVTMYRDLAGADQDVIRVRATGAEDDGSISIDAGVDIVAQSRDMLLAAACSVRSPQPFYRAGANRDAIEYMRKVRLGQTEHGSFVVTLLAPAPPQLQAPIQLDWASLDEEPFERQVTRRLVDALAASKAAAEAAMSSGESLVFERFINRGVSANLCDAIANLIDQSDGLDISLTWARTRPTPEPRSRVIFATSEAVILREVARTFRSRESKPDQTLLGYVHKLRRGPDDDAGSVTLKTLIENKEQSVATILSEPDYSLAVKAHDEKSLVIAKGDLERVGQRWHLWNTTLSSFGLDDL